MQLREISPGDVLFFSPPNPPTLFHQKLLLYQALLSGLLCYCNKQDYQKSHVAICTGIDNGRIIIAHIGANGKFINEIMLDKMHHKLLAALRPKDKSYATILANTASRSTSSQEIFFSKRSFWTVLPCMPSHRDTFLTSDKFSRESHCSRFIYEALNLAAKKHGERSGYQINASGDISVSRLWQRLLSSDNYTDLQSPKRESKALSSERPTVDRAPLLHPMS